MSESILVLVVEDDAIILLAIEDALTDGGFAVTGATTGDQAMALLEPNQSGFSALVTDINLGRGVTGWDVAKRAREINPDIAVLYTTGTEAERWASRGVPNSLLISKPFATAQIVTGIAQLLNATGPQG